MIVPWQTYYHVAKPRFVVFRINHRLSQHLINTGMQGSINTTLSGGEPKVQLNWLILSSLSKSKHEKVYITQWPLMQEMYANEMKLFKLVD